MGMPIDPLFISMGIRNYIIRQINDLIFCSSTFNQRVKKFRRGGGS